MKKNIPLLTSSFYKAAILIFFVCLFNTLFAQSGANDPTFNPGDIGFGYGDGADFTVCATTIQSNGKIIIGGYFTSYNGTARNHIARLNSDGSLDPTFDPGTGANSFIWATAIQSDGKIIIVGDFTSYNGTAINRIARLNTNGSLDVTFNPGTGANITIRATAIQSDGKIVIGGEFTSYNGITRKFIARLNTDGSLDPTFNTGTGPSSIVRATAIQSDGKIIIGGYFNNINGTTRNFIARLNTIGSLDTTFDPGTGANYFVNAAAIQSDGKIIIGGEFTAYNGTGRNRVARILNCINTFSSVTITACDSYTWFGTTYTASGTPTHVLTNAAGCDSIITLNLTIGNSFSTLSETACDSYTLNSQIYTAGGVYVQTLTNSAGCDSVITLNLTIDTVDVSVSVNDPVITANAIGATYQWVDCDNGYMPVSGEINQIFTANANGNYAVIVTQGLCTDTSVCTQITSVGITSIQTDGIAIYPNPVSDELIIENKGNTGKTDFEIINSIGQVVFKGNLIEKAVIQTSAFSPGVYLIKLENGRTFEFKKIVKE